MAGASSVSVGTCSPLGGDPLAKTSIYMGQGTVAKVIFQDGRLKIVCCRLYEPWLRRSCCFENGTPSRCGVTQYMLS